MDERLWDSDLGFVYGLTASFLPLRTCAYCHASINVFFLVAGRFMLIPGQSYVTVPLLQNPIPIYHPVLHDCTTP